MTVELRPFGVRCNLACTYCYQDPQRAGGPPGRAAAYSLDAMKDAAARRTGQVTLFGGEPLLLGLDDLEDLLRWGAARPGGVGIQTNGTLITDAHVALFRAYDVSVGISVDGPDELNDLRWHGSLARTRAATAATHRAIAKLAHAYRPPGLIVTLHRRNAAPDVLGRLLAWAGEIDALGVRSMRLHLLEVDGPAAAAAALTEAENIAALTAFDELQARLTTLRFDVPDETRAALRGQDGAGSCVWGGCDPYTTPAVQGIEGDGRASNCGRTNKDGVDFGKADRGGFDRSLALYVTPREDGGCAGCRFFLACRGQCPGTGIDGDWRNRSEHCGVWLAMFARAERSVAAEGRVPVSLDPRRPSLERRLTEHWRLGRDATIAGLLREEEAAARATVSVAPTRPEGAVDAPVRAVVPEPRISFAGTGAAGRGRALLAAARRAAWMSALAVVAAGHEDAALVSPGAAHALDVRSAAATLGLHARVVDRPAGGAPPDQAGPLLIVGGQAEMTRVPESPAPACCQAPRSAGVGAAGTPPLPPPWLTYGAAVDGPTQVDVPADAINLLWWRLGIVPVGHPPCSPACAESLALAANRRAAAVQAGIDGLAALDEVLAWPAEWSALHGVAELRAPLLRLTYPVAYTPRRLTVRFDGPARPADRAVGLNFPYRLSPTAAPRRAAPSPDSIAAGGTP
ncbi:radical SAM protein [Pseudofrankia inefficax]|uniref:Radical SAM domain protein n=1 Tax=Pseudofrankia inefficax (strain DSM 45817 / CECT 9037 / DDB 130130 / EuI1c) TaxID=298654 RepID=E3IUI0_PSEI1|nr:radical SAM protein [Pseudofrankia inefficax]ADP83665.1 Radical SAM domain protein [Pseudofrankia inefficax]